MHFVIRARDPWFCSRGQRPNTDDRLFLHEKVWLHLQVTVGVRWRNAASTIRTVTIFLNHQALSASPMRFLTSDSRLPLVHFSGRKYCGALPRWLTYFLEFYVEVHRRAVRWDWSGEMIQWYHQTLSSWRSRALQFISASRREFLISVSKQATSASTQIVV